MGNDLFIRNVPGMTKKLGEKTVAIAGCGGLGSNAATALTRAGIGALILADFDTVEESNLNRQYFFQTDIGRAKVNALAKLLKKINPKIKLTLHNEKITKTKTNRFFGKADILIEAFDKAPDKMWLIEYWSKTNPDKPIIIGSGLAGLGDNDSLKVRKTGNIYICGDEKSDMKMGLCSARVAIVANMQANVAIELLMKDTQ